MKNLARCSKGFSCKVKADNKIKTQCTRNERKGNQIAVDRKQSF